MVEAFEKNNIIIIRTKLNVWRFIQQAEKKEKSYRMNDEIMDRGRRKR